MESADAQSLSKLIRPNSFKGIGQREGKLGANIYEPTLHGFHMEPGLRTSALEHSHKHIKLSLKFSLRNFEIQFE